MTRPTFITLGPSGTCHENALLHYLEFQGHDGFRGRARRRPARGDRAGARARATRSSCSAARTSRSTSSPSATTARSSSSTRSSTRRRSSRCWCAPTSSEPRSLGIVSATKGYTDLTRWETLIDEPSKPVVARHLLARRYDAGLTHLHYAHEHPDGCASRSATERSTRPGSCTERASASAARSSDSATRGCSRPSRAPRGMSPRPPPTAAARRGAQRSGAVREQRGGAAARAARADGRGSAVRRAAADPAPTARRVERDELSEPRPVQHPLHGRPDRPEVASHSSAIAWSVPITTTSEYGSYSSTPLVSDGVVYSQDLSSNVQAIDLKTGKVLWTHSFESPDQGPNGLASAAGASTARPRARLSHSTRRPASSSGRCRWCATPTRASTWRLAITTGSCTSRRSPATTASSTVAEVSASCGRSKARPARSCGISTPCTTNQWSANADINSGGGLWYTPAFDEQGFMYIGVANPAPFPGTTQFPWGSSRPGPQHVHRLARQAQRDDRQRCGTTS